MPITCCVDSAARILQSRASGIVSFQDIVEHLAARERLHVLAYPELFDARDARFDLSIPDLPRILDEVRRVMSGAPQGAVAVVTNSNFIRGLARAYASLAIRDYPAFEIFDQLPDAQEWLTHISSAVVDPPGQASQPAAQEV